jgi:AcrR family transcriptional regulator
MMYVSRTDILHGMTVSDAPKAGRPRSFEADRAILDTTLRLLVEQGYDAMSIEGVAAAAGVGKTTIYRRYPSKRELVVAAVSSLASAFELPPSSGSVRDDLLAFMRQSYGVFRTGLPFAMLGTLLVKERDDPALMELFRRQIIRPRMEVLGHLLRQGIEHGELRPDIPIDVTIQMFVGAVFARHVSGWPEDDEWMETLVDTLLRGLASAEP